jgi:hypothetical protein
MKENEMARLRREMNTKFWYGNLKERIQLEDLDVDGGRMLKQMGRESVDRIRLEQYRDN